MSDRSTTYSNPLYTGDMSPPKPAPPPRPSSSPIADISYSATKAAPPRPAPPPTLYTSSYTSSYSSSPLGRTSATGTSDRTTLLGGASAKQPGTENDKIRKIQDDIHTTIGITTDNLRKAMDNGDSIKALEDKSGLLARSADRFKVNATDLRKRMCCKSAKSTAILVIVILIVIAIIVGIIAGLVRK